jgi:hypothetical protein
MIVASIIGVVLAILISIFVALNPILFGLDTGVTVNTREIFVFDKHVILDGQLEILAAELGDHFDGYRNHCLRPITRIQTCTFTEGHCKLALANFGRFDHRAFTLPSVQHFASSHMACRTLCSAGFLEQVRLSPDKPAKKPFDSTSPKPSGERECFRRYKA